MKAAVVTDFSKPPRYGEFREPVAGWDGELVTVTASALSGLTKARASGAHYSAGRDLPIVAGVDGVGQLADGERVYFMLPQAPFGAMAERVAMARDRLARIPDGLDDVTAAAIANAGMSSWAALVERAHLRSGETVLINGATGSAGKLAVRIAKILGAGKVIALGRNAAALSEVKDAGADATYSLLAPPDGLRDALENEFRARVDVVLDYLWGTSAEAILHAVAAGDPETQVRYVQIGSIASTSIALDAHVLRATGLSLVGSGLGSVPLDALLRSIEGVFDAAAEGSLSIATTVRPLTEVAAAWNESETQARTVFRV